MSERPTLSVKNFEQFQHYKDRTPPWIRLYNSLLDDYEFGQLPDASKWHLVAIWLLASRYSNKIPHDSGWISKHINATENVDLQLLVNTGFLFENQPLEQAKQDASATLAKCYTEKSREDSVPNGTGAEAPDWKAVLFSESLEFLSNHYGKSPDKMRSLLGKWRKSMGEDCETLVTIIREAEVRRMADPVEWIEASVGTRTGTREPQWKREKIEDGEEFLNA